MAEDEEAAASKASEWEREEHLAASREEGDRFGGDGLGGYLFLSFFNFL